MVYYDPSIGIRAVTIGLVVGVICAVIAAAIAIPIVIKNIKDPQVVVKATLRVALNRHIVSYELDQFYDKQATLRDLIQSLNDHYRQSNLSATFLNLIISKFTERPFLIDSSGNKRSQDRPSIVAVEGFIYFTQNHTGAEILAVAHNYSRYITLITRDGHASSALATFSELYSFATNTTSDQLTEFKAKELRSIDIASNEESLPTDQSILFLTPIKDSFDSINGTILFSSPRTTTTVIMNVQLINTTGTQSPNSTVPAVTNISG